MTSEPDSKPGRRPPTIELKATEVQNAAPAESAAEHVAPDEPPASKPSSGEGAPEPPAGGSSGGRRRSFAVSAVIGVIVVAAILAGLWFAGFGPSREAAAPAGTAPTSAAAPTPAIGGDVAARLDKIERTVQAQHPEPALANRLTATETQTKSLAESLSALNRRIDDIAAASQSASKQAGAAAAAAEAAKNAAKETSANQSPVQRSDIDALANRVAALESAVKAFSDNETRQPVSANDRTVRFTVAAEALRAAAERGVPFGAELAAVQALGADQNAVAPLEPFAAGGVPSAAALGRELAALTPQLQQASGTPAAEASFLGRLEAHAQELVRVTPVDAPAGSNPSTAVARVALDAARADIAAALTDIAGLSDAARPLTADWVKRAQARDAALATSRQIAADALAALSKPASQ